MTMPAQHNMRRKKNMIVDAAVVTDVIAAPQHDIVADGRERLNGIVFENKTVIADLVAECGGVRRDVRNERISFRFRKIIDVLAVGIHFPRSHRGEKKKIAGRVNALDFFERHNRQAVKIRLLEICRIYRKSHDFTIRIVREVIVRQFSGIEHTENHYFFLFVFHVGGFMRLSQMYTLSACTLSPAGPKTSGNR